MLKPEFAERNERIITMRRSGATYGAIAQEIGGITPSRARHICNFLSRRGTGAAVTPVGNSTDVPASANGKAQRAATGGSPERAD